MYRYVHNLQGDIVAILDAVGNLVVEYKYDVWGNSLSIVGNLRTTLGEVNPFRYRGYVWDEEMKLYYLRSRYFSAQYCRFMGMDILIEKDSIIKNVFSYCNNIPTILLDKSGNRPIDALSVQAETRSERFISFTTMYPNTNRLHICYKGKRYKMNSKETYSLYRWDSIDVDFMKNDFDRFIEEASSYSDIISVFRESIGGKLDFKLKLKNKNPSELYLLDGFVYNRNEAGNFMWSYYLRLHNYGVFFHSALAQGGSFIKGRFDEVHDIAARWDGLGYYEKRYGAGVE